MSFGDRLQPCPQVVRVLDHEAAGVDRDGVHRGAHPLLAAPGHDLDDSGGCRPDHIQALGAQRRRQSDQASGVERIDDHTGPRGRVRDAPHVEAQATSRGEAGNEAIRNEEERLAARDSRQAAAHALEHLQREPRVVDGFSEHNPRPAPRLPLGRPCVLEDADRHDLLDRRGEGHRVPRLDHLRLVLGEVDIPPVGAPALRRQPRQRLAQDRAVGGELLRERRRAARRHERHLVLRPQVLVEEALEGLAHADEALELHVDVVDREHDVASGQLRLAFRRHVPGGDGRRRRGRDRLARPRERLELHDRLRLAVLEHGEILATQAGSRPPALFLDDDVDAHELDARRGQDGGGGRLRRLRAQRGRARQDAEQADESYRRAAAFSHHVQSRATGSQGRHTPRVPAGRRRPPRGALAGSCGRPLPADGARVPAVP